MNHLNPLTADALFGKSSYKNYKYNGKELQQTGMYDYDARMYMPDIGRWGVVDPLAEKARRFSLYTYASDDPVGRLGPDGRFDSWFGAFMHKTFNGHWGSKVQQNDNEKSANQGKYYYSYEVVGKTSAAIMKADNMGYDKTLDDATEDYDKRTYPKELKPEDY